MNLNRLEKAGVHFERARDRVLAQISLLVTGDRGAIADLADELGSWGRDPKAGS